MANVIYDVIITSNPVFEVVVNNGASGKQGNKGDSGDVGKGVATGGVVGQYLTKKSSTDYDTEFKTIDSTEVAYGDGNVSEGLDNRYTKVATDLLLDGKSPVAHIHDDRYYTETELNNGQLDNRYYTETETNDLLDDKMNLDGSNSDVITLTYSNGTTLTIDPDRLIANFAFPDGTTANVPSELWYAEGKSLEVITEGDNIMFAGSQGDHYLVKKAVASELAANPHLYAGVSTKTTPINGWVKITRWGLVNNINTNGWAYGTRLYFNPSTLGFTDVLPNLPLARIYVGMVVRTGIATGIILVDPEDKSLYTNSELDTLFLGKVDKSTKATFNADGGFMIRLTNKTGANSVKGTVVMVSNTTDNAFRLNIVDSDMPIGVCYESGIADGQECWVVVSGKAQVLLVNTVATTRGYIIYSSGSVAGRVDSSSTVPAATVHFREIGHALESKTSGTDVLVYSVIHFN